MSTHWQNSTVPNQTCSYSQLQLHQHLNIFWGPHLECNFIRMFGGGKARTEQLCLTSWFSNWSCQQVLLLIFNDGRVLHFEFFRERGLFLHWLHRFLDLLRKIFCLAWLAWGWQRVGMSSKDLIDILEIVDDGPEMFDCQLKLVTSWWRRWSPQTVSQTSSW